MIFVVLCLRNFECEETSKNKEETSARQVMGMCYWKYLTDNDYVCYLLNLNL
jgi:hypothetical protein